MRQQPVVTAVQLVDLGQPGVLAQQIGEGTALKPLAMQPSFAARRRQAIGNQHEQDLIPPRPLRLTASRFDQNRSSCSSRHSSSASQHAPHCRGWRNCNCDSLDLDDRGVRQHSGAAVFRKQRQRPRLRGAFLEHPDHA